MYFNADTMKKELITDIKGLPINVQKEIANKIKIAEAQILVQMELNPDGLNDYLNAELKSAINQIQRAIKESQREGTDIIPISKWYVAYNEYAKKLNEYKQLANSGKTSNKPDTLPKKLLDNHTFKAILKKAIKAGFVEKTAEGYKWNGGINEWAYFAQKVSDLLGLSNKENDTKKFVNWHPFVELFGIDKKTIQKLYGALSEVTHDKYPKRKKEIDSLFN